MHRFTIAVLLASLFAINTHAADIQSARDWIDKGGVAFNKHDFAAAADAFQHAIAAGYPSAEGNYELACALARDGKADAALAALEKSATAGYRHPQQMQTDTDLLGLHTLPDWSRVTAKMTENAQAYHVNHNDPEKFMFVTSDIKLFWSVYDKLPDAGDPSALLDHEYLGHGTVGLQDFIHDRIRSGAHLLDVIQKHPKYYAAIRPNTLKVAQLDPEVRESMRKFKMLYPNAEFPDVYFVIGALSSGGTSSDDGLMLGTEMFSRDATVPTDELDTWASAGTKTMNYLPNIITHELMHFQQNYDGDDLLGHSVKEGAADFLASLVSRGNFNDHIYAYGYAHESVLKQEFAQDMKANDQKRWFGRDAMVNGRPADLGYFMGYRICQAYYNKAKDKKQAVSDILNIKDFGQFLKASGYLASS
ncbi:hypothetical protein [Dyella acidisoli]|uniref:DUF2268 domain-containing protein n=1 Tax=Dyella acidisoli TaxID=1867834 RepID=A0ABQ5XV93_9GAMM|nr:hypothetical protein [Dyella acidisoli]GLQ94416.1 hypothetical protein GCM10007901_33680 [Dyella acidisoli]